MKKSRILLFAFVLVAATNAAAQQALIGARDTARPGGSYLSVPAADAAACARVCERDGLCMAWTQRADGLCELKAVIPAPIASTGAVSGLSARAPDFARHVALAPEVEFDLAPAQEPTAAGAPHDVALLGGLTDADHPLRPRFSGGP